MGRHWVVALAVAAALVVTVTVIRRGDGQAAAPVTPRPPEWTTSAAEVVGVRRVDERSVAVVADLPAGDPLCARDLRIELLQDQEPDRPDVIYANVVFSSANSGVLGGCPDRATAEVTMRVAKPLGRRVLLLNSTSPAWAPTAGPGYRECDDVLGCHPPADHCDPVWVDQAVLGMDVPVKRVRSIRDVLGCDGTWLVLDLNRAAGDCPPAEGAPVCDVPSETTRLFLHFGPHGWDTVAGGKEAGCAPVRTARPDFPEALCRALPAVG